MQRDHEDSALVRQTALHGECEADKVCVSRQNATSVHSRLQTDVSTLQTLHTSGMCA